MQRITLAIFIIVVAIAYLGCSDQPKAVAAEDRGLPGVGKWVDSHIIPYHIGVRYETGRSDITRSYPPTGALALYSFDLPESHTAWPALTRFRRCMLYDTSLAVIFCSLTDRHRQARGLLLTMEHLQSKDGSIGFGWNSSGDGFYNVSYIRSGAVAWAGYSSVVYEQVTGDKRFRKFAESVARYILSQQVPDAPDSKDPRRGLVKGGSGLWAPDYSKFTKDKPMTWACVEHNVDSYFFLAGLGRLTGNKTYSQAAETIKRRMLATLWCESEGRFYAGIGAEGKLDKDHALDASSWGGIFLSTVGEKAKARRALAYVEKTYRSTACGVKGYKAYAGHYANHPMTDWGPKLKLAWSEGGLGVALAYLRSGESKKCAAIEREVITGMQVDGGGVRYTIYGDDLPIPAKAITLVNGKKPTDPLSDFVRTPTAAGTLWLGLVQWSREKKSNVFWGPETPAPKSLSLRLPVKPRGHFYGPRAYSASRVSIPAKSSITVTLPRRADQKTTSKRAPDQTKPTVSVWVEGSSIVRGFVTGISPDDVKLYGVKIWAKTDIWYIQPYVGDIHSISSKLTFRCWTRKWYRLRADLIDRKTGRVLASAYYRLGQAKPKPPAR